MLGGVLFMLLAATLAAAPPEELASPSDVYGGDLALTATHPEADDIPPADTSFLPAPDRPVITWKDRFESGKDKVAVDVFQPAGKGRFPVVVLLHGAGPRKADKHYQRIAESLAEHGYLSLYVHYYDRGRRGRGSRTQWGQAVSDALTFASRLESADSDHMGLVGFSLGAFLALGKAGEDPRVQAVVAYYGGISHGEPPEEAKTMPPTLLFHGTADRVVPVRRSLQTFQALREEHRQVDLVVYPGARHGFCLNGRGGPDGRAAEDSWERSLAFFSDHLRPQLDATTQKTPVETTVAASQPVCPAVDPLPEPPAYLMAPRAGVESTVALIDPDADTVLSLVPQRSTRPRSHRSVHTSGSQKTASVALPSRVASR